MTTMLRKKKNASHEPYKLVRSFFRQLTSLVLSALLVACSGPQPPRSLVGDALLLQIELTQKDIAKTLELSSIGDNPIISRVRITKQNQVQIGDVPGIAISGFFDWQLPGDSIKVDSGFEIYLQRGELDKSWLLARPKRSSSEFPELSQEWLTYPLNTM